MNEKIERVAEAIRDQMLAGEPYEGTVNVMFCHNAARAAIKAMDESLGGPVTDLDEAAITSLLDVLAPILTHGQGMAGRANEERARVALRAFLVRARTPHSPQ